MSEKRCGDCEYFVAFRNMNYETCTCDTITEYCELLQNEDTYDRDKGDEIWNDVFDDCPLKTGYISTESAILLLQSKKEVRKQFDNYVRISCEKKEKLQDENERLKKEKDGWKLSTCQYMNKDSVLMMDCQIVHEALFELERLIEADTEQMERFNDLKDKFKGLVNHYLGVFDNE